ACRARVEEARKRDHRRLGVQLDLFHLDEISPGSPFWHPKGMVIWNTLEDVRRHENARRGYVEVRTPLIYDQLIWEKSGHWEKFREHMFLIPHDERTYSIKPMNCPGHMWLVRTALGPYRDLPRPAPLRGGGAAPPQRARRRAPRPHPRAHRHPGRRAHLHHARADRGRDLRLPRLRDVPLRALRPRGQLRALDAPRQQARHRRGV